jgi:hypothetical protein
MGNMLTARVTIKGTRPLMWHSFGPDAIPLEKQERTGVAGNDPVEWQKTVLYTKDGQLYVRGDYVFGSMRDAARHTKRGRGSIQKYVQATLQVGEDRILIDRSIPDFNGGLPDELPTDPELPVYLDVRSVRNPSTRGRNVRYRVTASPGWRCEFTLLWDATVVSRGEMETVLIDAGKLVGLGDGRTIGMGRFEIEAFDITE